MKKKLIFLMFLLAVSVFAYSQVACNPPLNLTGTAHSTSWSDVALNWSYPTGTNAPDQWLSWSHGTSVSAFRLVNVIMVHRYVSADLLSLNSKDLTMVRFYTRTTDTLAPGDVFSVNIYKGGSYVSGVGFSPGTLVYTQAVSPDSVSSADWTTVILDSAVTIDATQEMWIGIQTSSVTTRCYFDATTSAESMKGNVCYYNGNWTTVSTTSGATYNWAIKGWVAGGGTIVDGFNVYRDAVLITSAPVTAPSYSDLGVSIGTHTYGVTAVYNADTCESAPVTTQITMGQDPCDTFVINTYPWTQDFETEFWRNCISVIDADGDGNNWYRGTTVPHSGTYMATSASYASVALTPDNYLILPPLLVPPSGARLSFWVAPQDTSWRAEHYEVLISTTGTDTADFSTSLFSETIAFNAWTLRTVDILGTAYAGQTVYIAFVHNECSDLYRMKIDDITIENLGACLTPSDFTADNISNTAATLGWTESGSATSWNIEYGLADFTQGTGTAMVASTNPVQLTALAPHTTYDVYVQADCGVNGTSEWLQGTFTTAFDNIHYETFEDYTAGEHVAESAQALGRTFWTTWSGTVGGSEDAVVSTDEAAEGVNAMEVTYNNDCVVMFPQTTSGTHTVEADFYVPSDKVGYFNVLQNFGSTNNWGAEIYFNASSFGFINAGGDTAATFTYPYDQWFHLKFVINLDSDDADFYFADSLIYSWQWSIGANGSDGVNSLHAMDFYGHATVAQYYVDNIDYDYIAGIQQNSAKNKLLIYPNPASNLLHIVGTADYDNVEIINFMGQVIMTENNIDNQIDVNISNLSSGVYFVRLRGDKGIISGKFIKK
jgi:hypothetical protein